MSAVQGESSFPGSSDTGCITHILVFRVVAHVRVGISLWSCSVQTAHLMNEDPDAQGSGNVSRITPLSTIVVPCPRRLVRTSSRGERALFCKEALKDPWKGSQTFHVGSGEGHQRRGVPGPPSCDFYFQGPPSSWLINYIPSTWLFSGSPF